MKRNIRSQIAIAMLLAVCLVSASCKDQTLATLASDERKADSAMHDIQGAIIAANKMVPPAIESPTAVKLMALCLRIDQGIEKSRDLTKKLNALGAADKQSLSAVLDPILSAVNDAIKDPAISGIKNPNTRAAIQGALVTLQTTFLLVQQLIASGK